MTIEEEIEYLDRFHGMGLGVDYRPIIADYVRATRDQALRELGQACENAMMLNNGEVMEDFEDTWRNQRIRDAVERACGKGGE